MRAPISQGSRGGLRTVVVLESLVDVDSTGSWASPLCLGNLQNDALGIGLIFWREGRQDGKWEGILH